MNNNLSNLKELKWLINEGCYDQAVGLAKMLGLPAYHGKFEDSPNTCEYWEINYPITNDSYCYLLDAAYTTGNAGWFRLYGRWI